MRHCSIGRRQWSRRRESEPDGLIGDGVIQRAVGGMQPDGSAGFGGNAGNPDDMVDVRVCQPDRNRLRPRCLHLIQDQTGLFTRIHNGTLASLLVHDEIAVLGEHAVGDRNDFHFVPFPSPSRSALRYFSTAIAAVVASPTAVVICRVTWLRTSPAANRPAIDVIMRLSVII